MNDSDAMLHFVRKYTETVLANPGREIRNISVVPLCLGLVQVGIVLDGGDPIFFDLELAEDIPLAPELLNAVAAIYNNAAVQIRHAIDRDLPTRYAGREVAH